MWIEPSNGPIISLRRLANVSNKYKSTPVTNIYCYEDQALDKLSFGQRFTLTELNYTFRWKFMLLT